LKFSGISKVLNVRLKFVFLHSLHRYGRIVLLLFKSNNFVTVCPCV